MLPHKRIPKLLMDIESIIDELEKIIHHHNRDFNDFSTSFISVRAVERDLMIIGEAVSQIKKLEKQLPISSADQIIGNENHPQSMLKRVRKMIRLKYLSFCFVAVLLFGCHDHQVLTDEEAAQITLLSGSEDVEVYSENGGLKIVLINSDIKSIPEQKIFYPIVAKFTFEFANQRRQGIDVKGKNIVEFQSAEVSNSYVITNDVVGVLNRNYTSVFKILEAVMIEDEGLLNELLNQSNELGLAERTDIARRLMTDFQFPGDYRLNVYGISIDANTIKVLVKLEFDSQKRKYSFGFNKRSQGLSSYVRLE